MARAGDVDQVKIVLLDEAIEVNPGKRLAWVGSPVAKETVLDVLGLEWLTKQRVLEQVEHADAEIIASAPVGIDLAMFLRGKRFSESGGDGSTHDRTSCDARDDGSWL
jgi:hypothetical protein